MSYNRRGGMQNQSNIGNIGRRRQQLSNNFVPGGQLTPQKGGVQQSYNNKPTPQNNRPQQSQPNTPVRAQQQQQQQQQKPVQPAPVQQTPPTPVPKPQPPPTPVVEPEVVAPVAATPASENGDIKSEEGEKKKWMLRKIPKRERIRKRNVRLGKLLQPKNALMVLNEIVPNTAFEVVDHIINGEKSYKATVVIDGHEQVGFGKSKNCAKNDAAETALKYLVKNKKMIKLLNDYSDEKMDTSEGEAPEPQESTLPWQQFASFALFKLFDSWGESPVFSKDENTLKELKPAKKLPENAETLNPLMVVNQMFPNAQFEELPRTGNPPNFVFNVKCTIDGQSFTGSGLTKKLAKRNASYAVCTNLLGIEYNNPTDGGAAPGQ